MPLLPPPNAGRIWAHRRYVQQRRDACFVRKPCTSAHRSRVRGVFAVLISHRLTMASFRFPTLVAQGI
jgi:hypothetical protein